MKYFVRITATFLVVLLFIAVIQHIKLGNFQEIASPVNLNVPAAGTWKVTDYKLYSGKVSDEEALKQMLGKNAVFTENYASVAGVSCETPKYTVKKVNTEQFLTFTRNISIDTGIKSVKSEIISVTSGEKHFFDMIMIDDSNLAILSTGGIAYLKKVSCTAVAIKESETINASVSDNDGALAGGMNSSGVLLGIKTTISPDENKSEFPSYKYRTLWIGRENKNIMRAKETENLLVPRSTGFWKLDMSRVQINGAVTDKILSYPLENATLRNNSSRGLNDRPVTNYIQNITFAGNDFISLEYGSSGDKSKIDLNNLKIVPFSTPEQGRIKISDIFGEKAKDTLVNSAKLYLNSINTVPDDKKFNSSEENIGLVRKNGHWILKGRMNMEGANSQSSYKDFYISLIPEKKLVTYDNLTISWSDVKSSVPEALDIFESPNSDFAVVVTRNCLCVYDINNNILAQVPSAKYKINENDTIIMSEWATGDYTLKWDKAIGSIGKNIN